MSQFDTTGLQQLFSHERDASVKQSTSQEEKERISVRNDQNSDASDDRPLISALLTKHSFSVESVRKIIQEDSLYEANSSRYDDLWILRFVLSHGLNSKAAGKAAVKTMKFREEKNLNTLGDIRHKLDYCRDSTVEHFPTQKILHTFMTHDAVTHIQPDHNRGIVTIVKISEIDGKRIMAEVSEEDLFHCYMYQKEIMFQFLDDISRKTGRLTRQLKIIDLDGFKLKSGGIKPFKIDGAIHKLLEDYYPQQLGSVLIVNSGVMGSTLWPIVRPFLPRRMVEKFDFLPPVSKRKPKHLKGLLMYISERGLPERYGGKNKEKLLSNPGNRFRKNILA